jgi:hypothetical protein
MKTRILIPGLAFLLISFASFIADPVQQDDKKKAEITDSSMPDDVKTIVTNACITCHATDGKKIAMAKLNFSKWDSYSSAKQAKKSVDICNVLTKSVMPPKSYRESHPEVVPTQAQIDMICQWSKSLATKK